MVTSTILSQLIVGWSKALNLVMSGQLTNDHSMFRKADEIVPSSYFSYGQANESLSKITKALGSGLLVSASISLSVIPFYIVTGSQRESEDRGSSRTDKVMGVLSENTIRRYKEFGITRGSNPRGNGGLILGPSRLKGTRFYSSSKVKPAGLMALEQIIHTNKENPYHINHKVIDIIKDVDILITAYGNITSKPGNMTRESSQETLEGINREWFKKISKELGSGAFKFSPARRVEIPKPKGGTRSLRVGNPKDKIIQEAMRLVLDAVFAPSFSANSHGFTANRSCHTALNQVYYTFQGSNWFLEGDLAECFDSFDHKLLIKR